MSASESLTCFIQDLGLLSDAGTALSRGWVTTKQWLLLSHVLGTLQRLFWLRDWLLTWPDVLLQLKVPPAAAQQQPSRAAAPGPGDGCHCSL